MSKERTNVQRGGAKDAHRERCPTKHKKMSTSPSGQGAMKFMIWHTKKSFSQVAMRSRMWCINKTMDQCDMAHQNDPQPILNVALRNLVQRCHESDYSSPKDPQPNESFPPDYDSPRIKVLCYTIHQSY